MISKIVSIRAIFSRVSTLGCYFSTPTKPENDTLSPQLANLEKTPFNYEENVRKLKEIAKIVFPNIQQYSLKRQKQIFFIYTPYKMMDPAAFSQIEKNLIKSMTSADLAETVKFLKCFSLGKNLQVSQTAFLLIEQRLIKNLNSLTVDQFVSVLESYDTLAFRKNQKIYKALLGFYSNKLGTMPLKKSLRAAVFLCRSKQCPVAQFVDLLEKVFYKAMQNLEKLTVEEFNLVYFFFFSDFLRKNLLDPLSLTSQQKYWIKENINSILLTGFSAKPKEENPEKIETFLLDPKKTYPDFQDRLERNLERAVSGQGKGLSINDFFVFFDSFRFLRRAVPAKIEDVFLGFLDEKVSMLTPSEIFKLVEVSHDNELICSGNLRTSLKKLFEIYFEKYKEDFAIMELVNVWRITDFYEFGRDLPQKIRENLGKRIKTMGLDELLSILFLSLKEHKKSDSKEAAAFIDDQVMPAIQIVLQQGKTPSKTIFSLMKFLTNYESEIICKEFLPAYMKLLVRREVYQKAEEVINAMNFLEFVEKKHPQLGELTQEVKSFLNINFIEKTPAKSLENK